MTVLGRRNKLPVVRTAGPGAYLDGGEQGEILLPGRYVPPGVQPGDQIDVFVYRDSEDRLVATTEIPRAMVGDFACLTVLNVHPRVGAFLDWGLSKDLLLPFREQEEPVRPGQRVVVCLCLDPKSDRILATTRLSRHLSHDPPSYRDGQPVNILITSRTPLGYNAVIENSHRGLLYHDSLANPLQIGQRLKAFVRTVRPGGKIDLRLDASGYKRVAPLTDKIVEEAKANQGKLLFDDDSSPELIRARFGASKKAFKQALGKLYKQRRIRFTRPGIELLDNTAWSPGRA